MSIRTAISAALGAAISAIPVSAWAQATSDAERYGYGPHMMGGAEDGTG